MNWDECFEVKLKLGLLHPLPTSLVTSSSLAEKVDEDISSLKDKGETFSGPNTI